MLTVTTCTVCQINVKINVSKVKYLTLKSSGVEVESLVRCLCLSIFGLGFDKVRIRTQEQPGVGQF